MPGTKTGQVVRWALGTLLCAGCNGFPGTIPIAEAERRPEQYPSYAATEPTLIVTVDSQRWQVLPGALVHAPSGALQRLAGGPLVAVRGDSPPFATLFQPVAPNSLHQAAEIR
ncbi:MAG: hypothetical protein ACRENP_01525 [Longimicrobiales bacterium]